MKKGVSPHIEPPTAPQAQTSTVSTMRGLTAADALSYLQTVKETFEHDMDKYNEFLDIMKDFKAQRITSSDVMSRVKQLFKGNRDLILGFNVFLPKGYEITLLPEDEPFLRRKPAEYNEAVNFVTKIKERFQENDVYKAFINILDQHRKKKKSIKEVYKEVSVLFHGHPDILLDFAHFLPDVSGTACLGNPQPDRNHNQCENDGNSPMTATSTIHVEKPDLDQRNHVEKEKENKEVGDKNELGKDDGLDHNRKYAQQGDSLTDQYEQDPELALLDKMNQIQDPESYRKIFDCIRSFKSNFVTAAQFRTLATSVIGKQPDLMEACENFLTYVEKPGAFRGNKQASKSSKVDGDFVDHDMAGRHKNKEHDNGERDRYDRSLALNTKDASGQTLPPFGNREYLTKPIQELDLSNCESCTPSYRLLPENMVIPPASCRTEIGAEVLNDRWVSVTSGSEDYSFKHMRKNQYEESLFRCEDDRFELDMLLESANTTSRRVEELLNNMNSQTNKTDGSFRIEDHLTALDLRCIERLYGDHGADVMEVLRKNALLSLPIVLSRLKQKMEEWVKCRAEFNKVWADIYAKNYHKSLDHRSFYFKQQDTKSLSAKVLLAEIKEISENNQNEDETLLIASIAPKKPMKPHLEFEYPDPDIQGDLYHLIKYSCGEVCTPEQRDKVMRIWTTFLEPVLGVPSHSPNAQDKEGPVKADNYTAKNGDNFDGEAGSLACGAAYRKSYNSSKSGDECVSTEQSCSHGVLMAHGNFTVKNECSPSGDIIASKSDIYNDSGMMSAKLWAGKRSGLVEKGSGLSSAREKSINEENLSAKNKVSGPECANVDCRMEAIPHQESKDGVIIKQTAPSVEPVPEDVKYQACHEASEAHSKIEQEEGELSPRKDLEEKKISASGDTGSNREQTLCKVDPSPRRNRGEEISMKEVREETEANANDEGEGSAHGSSESENTSENGDVSASESPNGEECSPEEPDDDGDNDENDHKAEVVDAHDTEGTIPFSDRFLQLVKPLTMKFPVGQHRKERNSRVFYGNDSFYLLFRFHQILYARMQSAKLHASSPENKWRILNNANPTVSYARFKDALCNLLNGSSDNAKFEDECRAIIGAQSYVLFTLDKLIHKLIKQLQTIATDEMDNKLLQLYAYERLRSHGTFSDAVYHQNACFLIPEDNLYRIECFPSPMRLTIQLMKNEQDKPEPKATSMDPKFETYLKNEILSSVPGRKGRAKVSLKRNARKLLSGDEASDFQRAMQGVIVRNGLEMRVNCSTTKVSYVVGSEDSFYRIKKMKKSKTRNKSFDASNDAITNAATRN